MEIASVEMNDMNTSSRCSFWDAFEADDACQSRAFERCVPKSMMHVGWRIQVLCDGHIYNALWGSWRLPTVRRRTSFAGCNPGPLPNPQHPSIIKSVSSAKCSSFWTAQKQLECNTHPHTSSWSLQNLSSWTAHLGQFPWFSDKKNWWKTDAKQIKKTDEKQMLN